MGNHSKKRIGVLTGGGDCPGLNAVIRGVVKTAVRHHGLEAVGFEDGYEGLVLKRVLPLDYDRVSGILTLGGTILGTSNKANPFKWAAKGPDGSITFSDVSDGVLRYAQELGLESIVAIGGDGTMSIAKGLVEKGLHIVGVPKTIDNDIWGTDQTFGFDTAVAIATEAVDRIHTTAMAHHRVMVIEVMGRYAGWLALCAAVAGGGDVVLIPEIPYDIDKVCRVVVERSKKGRRFSIVVAAEGAKPLGGEMTVKQVVKDSMDPIRLGGVGARIAESVESCTGLESRVTVLGHLVRGGTPTSFDRILATRYGVKAAEVCASGASGVMVALRGSSIITIPISDVGGKVRLVDPGGPLVETARRVGTSFGE